MVCLKTLQVDFLPLPISRINLPFDWSCLPKGDEKHEMISGTSGQPDGGWGLPISPINLPFD